MSKINLVFLGSFSYPQGMADTKRNQHAIDALKDYEGLSIKVLILRQSSKENQPTGIHQGIHYETVMPDLLRAGFILKYPWFQRKVKLATAKVFVPGVKNILYVYGPPMVDNIAAVFQARKLGFKVIFDIVEDEVTSANICPTLWHKVNNWFARILTHNIANLADGVIVISSHLENKFKLLLKANIPLMVRPISVDLEQFKSESKYHDSDIRLFYSGSYGIKDGVEYLIKAFNIIAARHDRVRLVLTGKGDDDRMLQINAMIDESPFNNRIDMKGYLSDYDYYAEVASCEIPCMTRTNIEYAHAGFPFKLGEFLATGKPVIASRVSDVENFLEHCESAMLVQPNNVVEIVKAVEYLIENPEKAFAIGVCGREKAKQLFEYRTQGKALLNFFRML